MNRIADLRNGVTTIDDARKLMEIIAGHEIAIVESAAHRDQQIQRAKERHVERTEDRASLLAGAVERLKSFIMTHKDLFQRPRKIATDFGSFGLQEVEELVIENEEALLNHLVECGYTDCYEVVRTPIKKALKDRIKMGQTIPGCRISNGDTAVYKVKPSLLDEAKAKERPE